MHRKGAGGLSMCRLTNILDLVERQEVVSREKFAWSEVTDSARPVNMSIDPNRACLSINSQPTIITPGSRTLKYSEHCNPESEASSSDFFAYSLTCYTAYCTYHDTACAMNDTFRLQRKQMT